jgi:uncharacterized membrane protein
MARKPAVRAGQPPQTRKKSAATGAAAQAELQDVEVAAAARMHRYAPAYAAVIVGVVVGILAGLLRNGIALECGAVAFFLCYLVIVTGRLPRLKPGYLRVHADDSDTPAYFIILVVLLTIVATSISFFLLINSGGKSDILQLTLGILALLLGWLTIHAMLAFHYAYEYYGTDDSSAPDAKGRKSHVGGLDFPGKEMPDALSFMYFSFVVAMTAQVSDVTVTSNPMRRLVLLHGILSFFFNTVIIAVAVNIVVSLGH